MRIFLSLIVAAQNFVTHSHYTCHTFSYTKSTARAVLFEET